MFSALLLAHIVLGSVAPIVLIDAGHGGAHDGAKGICGAKEKDITLGISLELGRILNASGRVQAWLTRDHDADVALDIRAEMANRLGASLFISIHANASTNPNAHGIETFFLSRRTADRRIAGLAKRENRHTKGHVPTADASLASMIQQLSMSASHDEAQRFSLHLQNSLASHIESKGRGVLQAPFVVLKKARMPAALVEVGFLTHHRECLELASTQHQRRVAQALAHAVLTHLAYENMALAQTHMISLTR